MRLLPAALAVLALCPGFALAQTPAPPAAPPAATAAGDDPYIWLEDAESPRALEWVKAENARSLGVLEADPRYEALHQAALKIVDASDRIPIPAFRAGEIYNFWQDQTQVQGVWRRTSMKSYRTPAPKWETVLDLDALSKAEGKTWVWKGAKCREPDQRQCIVILSDGGEDAVEAREFDLPSKSFVKGGFELSRGKQDIEWLDDNHLIIAREWEPGAMTESGYPYVVKVIARGQPLNTAMEVFRGKPSDVGVSPYSLYDATTGARPVMINRAISFFEAETYAVTSTGIVKLPLPLKSTVVGLNQGQLILTLEEAWTPVAGGPTYPQGSLMAVDLAALERGETGKPAVLMTPGPRESIEQIGVSRYKVLVAAYENVKGRALVFTRAADGTWSSRKLNLPDAAAVALVDTDDLTDHAFIQVESFLDPPALYFVDAASGRLERLKSLPARFDASKDVTEQFEATSKDGTKVPYFVVRPRNMRLDGTAPTLLTAYGGFQVSRTPSYSGTLGKLWLERGGVYVLANIRGGGEFGPAWHEAGLKTHRQRIYDDFAAVAEDLIARKITSPRRLGIEGGSNGGLLMGVEFEQHPELWRATVIQVPLLDMLRFTKIGAGASWVGEYGSPDVPEERAFLASISPYHNLKAGVAYPEPLFVTSTKDDRVSPAHARKMAAKMQAMGLPFLYYENTEGGHAASANQHEVAHRVSLEMTYLTRKLMD